MITLETLNGTGRLTQGLENFDFIERRTIWLTKEITPAVSAEIIRKIRYLDRLNSDTITIMINSPGGSVTDGLAIIDIMKSASSRISTICCGQAGSVAVVILACGAKGLRRSLSHSAIIIHPRTNITAVQETDAEITCRHMQKMRNNVIEILSEATGQPIKKIMQDTKRSHYMTPKEAIRYGIIDDIL